MFLILKVFCVHYTLQGISILKAHGRSAKDSYLLKGYALNTGRAAQGMPARVAPAKIACLDFNLQKTKMQMGVQVLVTDPRELEKIRQRLYDNHNPFIFAVWIMFSYFGFVDAKLLIVTKFLTEKVAFSLKDQFGLLDAHAFLANKFHEFMISFFNNVSFCRLLEHVLEIAGKFF